MKISQIVQNHFRREATLSIPVSITSVHTTFAALSISGIVRGSVSNPHYKFNVQWAENVAILDGPHGVKLARLSTKVTVRPSLDRNVTILDLVIKIPIAEIYLLSIVLVGACTGIFIFNSSLTLSNRLISSLFFGILFYGTIWINVIYSGNIVTKHLSRNFSNTDR